MSAKIPYQTGAKPATENSTYSDMKEREQAQAIQMSNKVPYQTGAK